MRGVNKVYYNMCVEAKTEDVNEIEEDFVIDLIKQYLLDNDLPEEISL